MSLKGIMSSVENNWSERSKLKSKFYLNRWNNSPCVKQYGNLVDEIEEVRRYG